MKGVWLALAISALGCATSTDEDVGSGEHAIAPLQTLDDLPACDPERPSLSCIQKLFAPLRAAAVPFDAAKVAAATGVMESWVARDWSMTAHHVLAGTSSFPYGCFFDTYRYAADLVPFNGPGCGEMLVAGGHPHAPTCLAEGRPMRLCAQEVAPAEAFDFVIRRAPPRDTVLDLAAAPPAVGDPVFVVGHPVFRWLTDAERESLLPLYPLVSRGRVVRVDGRAVFVDAACYEGNSGGPLVNARGEAIGVMFSRVRTPAPGSSLPDELQGTRGVAIMPDEQARAIVSEVRAAGTR